MNRTTNKPAAWLSTRSYRTGMRLALVALGTLLLAACGNNAAPPQPTSIAYFNAQPLENGEGSWRLSWEVIGAQRVTINGSEYAGAASTNVTPESPTDYVLRSGSLEASLTLAPLSAAEIITESLNVYTTQAFSLSAIARAEGTGEEPSQSFLWSTSNAEVLSVTVTGEAEALAAGTATVTATSLQDSTVFASAAFSVSDPVPAAISMFSHTSDYDELEAGTPVVLEWSVTDAITVQIIEVVTGEVDRTVYSDLAATAGSLELELPTDKAQVNYRLQARNVVGDEVSQLLFTEPLPLPGWICSDPEDVITIADPSLEAAVWRIYGNTDLDPGDDILRCGMVQQDFFTPVPTDSDEYGLMELHNAIVINRCDQDEDPIVTTLEGIQHLSTLLRLELMCNEITDISRLAGLTSLQELNLDQNFVSDVTPLAGLTDLQVLGLYQNEVVDVSPLAALTEMRVLYLSENFIKDVSPLGNLTNVEHLWLYANCEVWPAVSRPTNCLQHLSGLEGLTSLKSLVFHVNEITDVSSINSGMNELELIFASENRIADISNLQNLESLSTVRLDTNLVSSISALALNAALPSTAAPFYWERIDPGTAEFPPNSVIMPPPAFAYTTHISLHMNCLDTDSAELTANLTALAERGALVEGSDTSQMTQTACTPSLSSLSVQPAPFNPAGLLREDSRWYRNRQ